MTARRILFICVGNTCRSPMAEAICRTLGGEDVEAFSAGLAPTGRVARETLLTLEKLGYPGAGLASKGLADLPLGDMDIIVSLIGDAGGRWLPRNLSARTVVWNVPDPYGEDLKTYLRVARRIETLVRRLLGSTEDDL